MVQPIDLRLKDNSNAQEYFAQMKQQQNMKDAPKTEKIDNQLIQEIENELVNNIEKELASLKNQNTDAKKESQPKNKIGMDEINDTLNKVYNMDSVFFQFELVESKNEMSDIKKKELVLKVINKETKEVLSQYPNDISIKIAKLLDKLIGKGQIADATA